MNTFFSVFVWAFVGRVWTYGVITSTLITSENLGLLAHIRCLQSPKASKKTNKYRFWQLKNLDFGDENLYVPWFWGALCFCKRPICHFSSFSCKKVTLKNLPGAAPNWKIMPPPILNSYKALRSSFKHEKSTRPKAADADWLIPKKHKTSRLKKDPKQAPRKELQTAEAFIEENRIWSPWRFL